MKAPPPNGKVRRRGVVGVTVEDRKIKKKRESPTGETQETTINKSSSFSVQRTVVSMGVALPPAPHTYSLVVSMKS